MAAVSRKLLITLVFIFFFSFLPSKSVGRGIKEVKYLESGGNETSAIQEVKTMLGSRPPDCVNKCNGCQPCTTAVMVVPEHPAMKGSNVFSASAQEEENYYLVSWVCKCADKVYQP